MVVIGTAGHIDHGKSSIVRRLTGTDPDRLPEEKARGMTIDLGFAFLLTESQNQIAFVDVPGHERFVKNMIAGAGGIDAVMLVIAADDGWMPQSEEHFQIIRLLGVTSGFIVINKIDLATPDWLELLETEISEKVAGSFLENRPIFPVSAETGDGFDKLSGFLEAEAGRIAGKKDVGKARLYADRSFVSQGIGQVVTGTLRGGGLKVGQPVAVWPSGVTGKLRTLQSRGEETESVTVGSRTAISLTGVDKKYLTRGCVISDRTDLEYFHERPVLALKVELLNSSPVALEDRRRVLLLIGSSESEGEVRLYDQKAIQPGQSGLAFFKPDDPLLALLGDHFIMRLVTPMTTLGGGSVLDHLPHFPRRRDLARFSYLNDRTSGGLPDLIITELQKSIVCPMPRLLHQSEFSIFDIEATAKDMIVTKQLGTFGDYVYHHETFDQMVDQLREQITAQLSENPHLKGIPRSMISRQSPLESDTLSVMLNYMVSHNNLTVEGDNYDVAGRGMTPTGVIKQAYEQIMADLKGDPFKPPTLSVLAAGGKNHKQAIKYILDSGEAYKCGSDFVFLTKAWDEYLDFIRESLTSKGQLTPADLRARFDISRKWVIPILEETDRVGLTERQGDIRIKGSKF